MADRDFPAVLDFIFAETGQEKINIVGHSMGGTIPFAYFSQNHTYDDRVSPIFTLLFVNGSSVVSRSSSVKVPYRSILSFEHAYFLSIDRRYGALGRGNQIWTGRCSYFEVSSGIDTACHKGAESKGYFKLFAHKSKMLTRPGLNLYSQNTSLICVAAANEKGHLRDNNNILPHTYRTERCSWISQKHSRFYSRTRLEVSSWLPRVIRWRPTSIVS